MYAYSYYTPLWRLHAHPTYQVTTYLGKLVGRCLRFPDLAVTEVSLESFNGRDKIPRRRRIWQSISRLPRGRGGVPTRLEPNRDGQDVLYLIGNDEHGYGTPPPRSIRVHDLQTHQSWTDLTGASHERSRSFLTRLATPAFERSGTDRGIQAGSVTCTRAHMMKVLPTLGTLGRLHKLSPGLASTFSQQVDS